MFGFEFILFYFILYLFYLFLYLLDVYFTQLLYIINSWGAGDACHRHKYAGTQCAYPVVRTLLIPTQVWNTAALIL